MADLAELRARLRSAEKRHAEAIATFKSAPSSEAAAIEARCAAVEIVRAKGALGAALIDANAASLDEVERAIDANTYADPDGGPDWVDAYDLKAALGIELDEGADVVAVHERRVEAARAELRAAKQLVESLWAAKGDEPRVAISYDQGTRADLRESIARLRLQFAELELEIARERASGVGNV